MSVCPSVIVTKSTANSMHHRKGGESAHAVLPRLYYNTGMKDKTDNETSGIYDITAFTFTLTDGSAYRLALGERDTVTPLSGGTEEQAAVFLGEFEALCDEYQKDPGLSHCDPMYVFEEKLKERRHAVISNEERMYFPEGTVC